MNNLLQIREKSKEPTGFTKLNLWQLKMEKQFHTEDPSLKKESGKHKTE